MPENAEWWAFVETHWLVTLIVFGFVWVLLRRIETFMQRVEERLYEIVKSTHAIAEVIKRRAGE